MATIRLEDPLGTDTTIGAAAEPIGDQVYQFTWGHETFVGSRHMTLADFARVLQTVRFP